MVIIFESMVAKKRLFRPNLKIARKQIFDVRIKNVFIIPAVAYNLLLPIPLATC
jgi:hypothetical protein